MIFIFWACKIPYFLKEDRDWIPFVTPKRGALSSQWAFFVVRFFATPLELGCIMVELFNSSCMAKVVGGGTSQEPRAPRICNYRGSELLKRLEYTYDIFASKMLKTVLLNTQLFQNFAKVGPPENEWTFQKMLLCTALLMSKTFTY